MPKTSLDASDDSTDWMPFPWLLSLFRSSEESVEDENGSDVFSKLVYGARVSIGVAITVVSLSVFIGLIIVARTIQF